jgi:hypothetical protein
MPDSEKRYITQETEIDNFTVKRTLTPLTPAVCDVCGFDLLAANNYPPYDEVDPLIQERAKMAIKHHKKYLCGGSGLNKRIVTPTELTKEWLEPDSVSSSSVGFNRQGF